MPGRRWRCFAFAEASFFPIPPDVMLLPMMLADRRRAFRLAAWCAFWSVMGGMLGYAIGALFWETAGLWLIEVLHIPLSEVENLRQRYTEHAYLIVAQGLTPIPYKLVTIASGLAGVPFFLFMTYSAITRSLRFIVLEGLLVHFFGAQAKDAAREISRGRAMVISCPGGAGLCRPALSLRIFSPARVRWISSHASRVRRHLAGSGRLRSTAAMPRKRAPGFR